VISIAKLDAMSYFGAEEVDEVDEADSSSADVTSIAKLDVVSFFVDEVNANLLLH
jgi:hypothetical protein